ncbi:hypothetical protein [uncultured Lamprocystis sp.]|jgi:hypothetical protein|uniref:hypothetical protein n=1 Tax=uncultured Lamprocystis sp. TaxID=543132 RepID=UPI0025EFBA79|nr:hypothetical protein [uncultured Lamprocystis sp.]
MANNKASSSQNEDAHENSASKKREAIKTFVAVVLASSTSLGIASETDKYITPEQQRQIIQKCDSDGDSKLSGREVLCSAREKNKYLKELKEKITRSADEKSRSADAHARSADAHEENIRKLKIISEALKNR